MHKYSLNPAANLTNEVS